MKKLLLCGVLLMGGLALQAQPPVSLYNTFIFHNNGTSEGIQSCTLHDSYTGFNISVTFPAPYLAPGASYSKVTWGSAYPVYRATRFLSWVVPPIARGWMGAPLRASRLAGGLLTPWGLPRWAVR